MDLKPPSFQYCLRLAWSSLECLSNFTKSEYLDAIIFTIREVNVHFIPLYVRRKYPNQLINKILIRVKNKLSRIHQHVITLSGYEVETNRNIRSNCQLQAGFPRKIDQPDSSRVPIGASSGFLFNYFWMLLNFIAFYLIFLKPRYTFVKFASRITWIFVSYIPWLTMIDTKR